MTAPLSGKPVRHILALFGGKDSSALAVFMKDKVPEMEYVFCDTGPARQTPQGNNNDQKCSMTRRVFPFLVK